MKIHYRVRNDEVEIVRCYGQDASIVIPEQIDGKAVTKACAYTFSARKWEEEEDVLVYETEEGMFSEEDQLLAGEIIEQVIFPDTMKEIGNYIFYGCKSLKSLEFSNQMMGIGSGAFTGCHSLNQLTVHMQGGKKTCVKEILGDLWHRIDIRLTGEEEAYLVFPGHYEEAVENTPARILFTQHHGSGNNYRQCFYNKEMDYEKYDGLFSVAKVYDQLNVLTDMAFGRILYPAHLSGQAGKEYEEYLRVNSRDVGIYLVDCAEITGTDQKNGLDVMAEMNLMTDRKFWNEDSLNKTIDYASREEKKELLSLLMETKYRLFPARKKRFEL